MYGAELQCTDVFDVKFVMPQLTADSTFAKAHVRSPEIREPASRLQHCTVFEECFNLVSRAAPSANAAKGRCETGQSGIRLAVMEINGGILPSASLGRAVFRIERTKRGGRRPRQLKWTTLLSSLGVGGSYTDI